MDNETKNPPHRGSPVARAAMLISLASFGVAIAALVIQAGFNDRQLKHNHLSLRPVFSFERVLVPDETRPFVGLYLHNAGEGPAKDFQLTVRIRDVDELPVSLAGAVMAAGGDPMFELRELLKEIYPASPRIMARGGVPSAMPAGSSLAMLGILREDFDEKWIEAFQLLMSHVEIEIVCRSLYEEVVKRNFEFHSESIAP